VEDNTVWIEKPVNVQLLTEEEFLQDGRRIGGAEAQPNAREFARSITRVLAGNDVPDYVRLRNDFRIVEAAATVHYKKVPAESLSFLLNDCPLRAVPPFGEVGGVRRVATDEAVCEVRMASGRVTGEVVGRSQLIYRGGVEVGVPVRSEDFLAARDGRLAKLARAIQASRPSPDSVVWQIAW
jgi:hypothetical protein